jgi:hypothetical protein
VQPLLELIKCLLYRPDCSHVPSDTGVCYNDVLSKRGSLGSVRRLINELTWSFFGVFIF